MKVTSSRQFSHNNLKIVLVLFCLITTAARAKDPSWLHAHSFGGSDDDFAWAIKVGPDDPNTSPADLVHRTVRTHDAGVRGWHGHLLDQVRTVRGAALDRTGRGMMIVGRPWILIEPVSGAVGGGGRRLKEHQA